MVEPDATAQRADWARFGFIVRPPRVADLNRSPMKFLSFVLLIVTPVFAAAKEPYAMIIHSSGDSASWGSVVAGEGALKVYFPASDTEVRIQVSDDDLKKFIQQCLSTIKVVTIESELAPIPTERGELVRIAVTTGTSHLDIECSKTNVAARDLISIVQRYLDEKKKEANQSTTAQRASRVADR